MKGQESLPESSLSYSLIPNLVGNRDMSDPEDASLELEFVEQALRAFHIQEVLLLA